MCPARTELLDHAIIRLVALPPQEQDRIAIEILADLCSEEEWALLAASEPYHNWLASRPQNEPEKHSASLLSPVG